jgi:N-methylhydantoinase A
MSVRIGVDIGGTFTDLFLFDDLSRSTHIVKVPSVPASPEKAIVTGVQRVLKETRHRPEDIGFFIHGTTIATNAIIEYKGARVALLVTEGFRDLLYIVRQERPKLYDYFTQHPPPLVLRRRTYEIKERMLHGGQVKTPLDEEATREVLCRIKHSGDVDIIAVCLLHSYANPIHERRIGELIREEIPGMRVSLSSDVLPEIKEYERAITTVVNAYVLPIVTDYLLRLDQELRRINVRSDLYIMQSNGGVMTAATATQKSVHTILSGPAAGAIAAMWIGRKAGFENLISIDMGGTSADVSLTHDGKLSYAKESLVSGHTIKVPTIDINAVGAGGGSIAWVDQGGALQVGPASAGADPGPACYGRGGQEPTVTDANLVLGRLSPDYFLGGEMKLDVEAARRAIYDRVARPLGLDLEQAADGIIKIVCATMVRGIRRVSVERGHDPRDFTLFPFGGGGPLHGVILAQELSIPRVLIPSVAGVGSALGCVLADFRHDYGQTVLGPFMRFVPDDLERLFKQQEQRALDQMQREGLDPSRILLVRSLDLRFVGQGFELEITAPGARLGRAEMMEIDRQYRSLYLTTYGYTTEDATELVSLRLTAIGTLPAVDLSTQPVNGTTPRTAFKGSRPVFFNNGFRETPIYDEYKVEFGASILGPAIIERRDSTTVVFPSQTAWKDQHGNTIVALKE